MKLPDLLRPLLQRFPRPNMHVLGVLGAGYEHDPVWKHVSPRYVSYIDRRIKCIVSADLAEWGGRYCYYWGRFYDLTHQLLLERFLKSGWTYIDVGANFGFQSLHAAKLVGPSGLVLSFEPNPDTFAVLLSHILINRLKHVQAFPIALSDAESEMCLSFSGAHSGVATLRQTESPNHSHQVQVKLADNILRDIRFPGSTILKIDVEGFELHTIRGCRETLSRVAGVNIEVTPHWIQEQGGSIAELMDIMKEEGFVPFVPSLEWTAKIFAPRLVLTPVEGSKNDQHDIFFARPSLLEL